MAPLLSSVTYPLLRLTKHRLQENIVYSPWFCWRYERLFHFCVGAHRFFPQVDVILNLKSFDVLFDNKLCIIRLYLFLLFCLFLFFFFFFSCWRAKMTNESSSSLRSFRIIKKEKYWNPKQVSLRQTTQQRGNWK